MFRVVNNVVVSHCQMLACCCEWSLLPLINVVFVDVVVVVVFT